MNLTNRGIKEFEKQYQFIELTEKEKSIVSLAYSLGYTDSKIDTYKGRISQ